MKKTGHRQVLTQKKKKNDGYSGCFNKKTWSSKWVTWTHLAREHALTHKNLSPIPSTQHFHPKTTQYIHVTLMINNVDRTYIYHTWHRSSKSIQSLRGHAWFERQFEILIKAVNWFYATCCCWGCFNDIGIGGKVIKSMALILQATGSLLPQANPYAELHNLCYVLS